MTPLLVAFAAGFLGAGLGAYLGVFAFFLVDVTQARQSLAEAEASADRAHAHMDAVEQALGIGA